MSSAVVNSLFDVVPIVCMCVGGVWFWFCEIALCAIFNCFAILSLMKNELVASLTVFLF